MTLEALEARIKVLEDIEEIRKLKATYCYLCDAGLDDKRNRDELVSHFTENAKVDFGLGPASRFEGHEGLKTFFGPRNIVLLYAHGPQPHHRSKRRYGDGKMVLRGADYGRVDG
jgi:hypothetical protein